MSKVAGLTICGLLSIVAVPVLVYFAILAGKGSHLLEIPNENKTGAAVGCWIAAMMYAATGCASYYYLKKERDAAAWSQQYRTPEAGTQLQNFGSPSERRDLDIEIDDVNVMGNPPGRQATPPPPTDFLS